MKKTAMSLMAIAAVLMFTACGGSDSRSLDGNASTNSNVPTANGDQIVIDNGQDIAIGDDNSIMVTCGEGGCGDITINRREVN